jgi:hypothetical protein
VAEDGAKRRYLEALDWLEALAPVAFSFANTADGRKVLFADGLFAEYAIFTVDELRQSSFPPGRIVWQRPDAPAGLELAGRLPAASPHDTVDFQVNEALTNLYVSLQREARGERLAATRLIQSHAVDRLMSLLDLAESRVVASRLPRPSRSGRASPQSMLRGRKLENPRIAWRLLPSARIL